MNVITITKFSVISLAFVIGFSFFNSNPVFAIEFSNYTSEKFKISFEYPTDWIVKEPTSRFDDQKITIDSSNILIDGQISISFFEDIIDMTGSKNIQKATEDTLNYLKNSYVRDQKVIEKISTMKIDGQDTRTFVTSYTEKFEKYPIPTGSQIWIVYTEKELGYLIAYLQIAENFDNPESIEIRDHFINSIKFL